MGQKRDVPKPPSFWRELQGINDVDVALRKWTEGMDTYAKEQDEFLKGVNEDVMGVQMPAMQDMYDWAQADRKRYEDVFVPQQDKFIDMANKYASPEEEQRQRAAAGQDTAAAYEAQKEAQLRKLDSYGIDPSQSRHAGLDQRARLSQAAATAQNQNMAAERTKAIGRQLQGQAINMGAGLPGQAIAQAGNAANIGASALSGAAGTAALGYQGRQAVLPGYSMRNSGFGLSADIKNADYANQMGEFTAKENQGSQLGGVGAVVGTGIRMASSGGAGGGMLGAAEGGGVDAPGGPTSDSGVLRLSDGEYVLPAEVVNNMGAGLLDKFVEKQTGVLPTRKQAIPVGV